VTKKGALVAILAGVVAIIGYRARFAKRTRLSSEGKPKQSLSSEWSDADVVILPTVPEWQEHGGDYVELSEAISADLGLSAVAEDRTVPHAGSDLPEFIPLAFLIYVGVKLADSAVDALVERVTRIVVDRARTRWWTKGKKVEGVIYGPDGEVLRRVIWESKEGEREWIDVD
jgi:hypothetical protein